MKHFTLKNLLTVLTIAVALSACKKNRVKVDPVDPSELATTVGVYVLNQGDFFSVPGSLTYYNYADKATTADKYLTANSTAAGIGTNDAKIYGSKMYITVDVDGIVNVVDKKTAKLIKQISFKTTDGKSREPRSIAFYKNNAFVTTYDGNVAVIDTAALTISKNIPVGRNPEQLVVSNNKLYVANSGGISTLDKTVSVIDLTSLTESKKIEVITNPVTIAADTYGNVYVLSAGNYTDVKPGMTIIDNKTDVVKTKSELAGAYGTSIVVNGDYAYFISSQNKVLVYNTKTQAVEKENFITDATEIKTPFNLAIDSKTGELFVADAGNFVSNGQVIVFDKTGKRQYAITAGRVPGAIVLLNK